MERAEQSIATSSVKALAILDLDHFKAINDRFGHDAGDTALTAFGRMLGEIADNNCTVGRIGGEEFALLSIGLDQAALTDRIEILRKIVARTPITTREGSTISITFSAGVASAAPSDDLRSLFHRADRALYQAKNEGRDRMAIAA